MISFHFSDSNNYKNYLNAFRISKICCKASFVSTQYSYSLKSFNSQIIFFEKGLMLELILFSLKNIIVFILKIDF